MQVSAMTSIKQLMEQGESATAMLNPLGIVFFFLMYPVVSFIYLIRNKSKMLDKENEDFEKRHGAMFNPFNLTRIWSLSFTLVSNYRRLLYSFVIVFLSDLPAHQI